MLDKRIKAVKDALTDGFGVEPGRVLQNAYEPIQYDETGSYCGNQATLGMDVHPTLKVNKARLTEVADLANDLQKRLECPSSTAGRRDCQWSGQRLSPARSDRTETLGIVRS